MSGEADESGVVYSPQSNRTGKVPVELLDDVVIANDKLYEKVKRGREALWKRMSDSERVSDQRYRKRLKFLKQSLEEAMVAWAQVDSFLAEEEVVVPRINPGNAKYRWINRDINSYGEWRFRTDVSRIDDRTRGEEDIRRNKTDYNAAQAFAALAGSFEEERQRTENLYSLWSDAEPGVRRNIGMDESSPVEDLLENPAYGDRAEEIESVVGN